MCILDYENEILWAWTMELIMTVFFFFESVIRFSLPYSVYSLWGLSSVLKFDKQLDRLWLTITYSKQLIEI